jgi:ferredoxin
MPTVIADVSKCQSYANCLVAAPHIFGLDDDGLVVLLKAEIDEKDLAAAEEAVSSCPAAALSLER